jgi:AcrR family transcriptional regulator
LEFHRVKHSGLIFHAAAHKRNGYTNIDLPHPAPPICEFIFTLFCEREFITVSPKRKQIADSSIADCVAGLLSEHGPAAATFAEVAKRCGLAPPTLVQRFGTREGMLRAADAALRAIVIEDFALGAHGTSRLDVLRQGLGRLAARSGLVWVIDGGVSLEVRRQVAFCLAQAIQGGELPRCDVAAMASAVQVAYYGAMLVSRAEGLDSVAEVAAAVETQLSAYV